MSNIQIGIVVNDTGAIKSLNDVNKSMDAVGKTTDTASKSTKAMGDSATKTSKSMNTLGTSVKSAGDATSKSSNLFAEFGNSLQSIGDKSASSFGELGSGIMRVMTKLGPFGIVIGATVGTLAALSIRAINMADDISEAADAVSMSTNNYQFYDNILKQNGSSMEKFSGSILNMTSKIESNDKSLTKLGVATKDINGNFRGTAPVLKDVLYALAKETDATQRSADAKAVFGKQARAVNTLIAAGTKGLDEYYANKEKYIKMDKQTIQNANSVKNSYEAIALAFDKFGNSILAFPMLKLAQILNPDDANVKKNTAIEELKKQIVAVESIAKSTGLEEYWKTLEVLKKQLADLNQESADPAAALAQLEAQQELLDKIRELNIETGLLKEQNKALYDQEELRYEKAIRGITDQTLLTAELNKHLATEKKIQTDIAKKEAERARIAEEKQAALNKASADRYIASLKDEEATLIALTKASDNFNDAWNVSDVKFKSTFAEQLREYIGDDPAMIEKIYSAFMDNAGTNQPLIDWNMVMYRDGKKISELTTKNGKSLAAFFTVQNRIVNDQKEILQQSLQEYTDMLGKYLFKPSYQESNPFSEISKQRDADIKNIKDSFAEAEKEAKKFFKFAEGQLMLEVLARMAADKMIVDSRKKMNDDIRDLTIQSYAKQIELGASYTSRVMDSIKTVADASTNEKLKELDTWETVEKEKVNSYNISARRKAQLQKDIEAKALDEKKKNHEKQKRWSIAQGIINGAVGITNAWANGGTWASNIIESGLVAFATGAEIAAISMQSFAGGGIIGSNQGASMGPDNTVINARNGEVVLNANQQRTLFNGIQSGSIGGNKSTSIDASITINGNASQSTVDQIKTEQQKFSMLIRDTVNDLKYRRQISFA